MKALTLTQPWATLIALGHKRYETRSWSTSYRGPLAIHAAKGLAPIGGWPGLHRLLAQDHFYGIIGRAWAAAELKLPLGAITAVCELADVFPTPTWGVPPPWLDVDSLSERERAFGDFSEGRFAWRLACVRHLDEPIPCRGALGLWDVPAEITGQL